MEVRDGADVDRRSINPNSRISSDRAGTDLWSVVCRGVVAHDDLEIRVRLLLRGLQRLPQPSGPVERRDRDRDQSRPLWLGVSDVGRRLCASRRSRGGVAVHRRRQTIRRAEGSSAEVTLSWAIRDESLTRFANSGSDCSSSCKVPEATSSPSLRKNMRSAVATVLSR